MPAEPKSMARPWGGGVVLDPTESGASGQPGALRLELLGSRRAAEDRELLGRLGSALIDAGAAVRDLTDSAPAGDAAAATVLLWTAAAAASDLVDHQLEQMRRAAAAPPVIVLRREADGLPVWLVPPRRLGLRDWPDGESPEAVGAWVVSLLRPAAGAGLPYALEPCGGGVPLGSPFYVPRPTDQGMAEALARLDSVVLVQGPRQIGKTSLLARALQQARDAGWAAAYTDFQALNDSDLATVESFYLAVADMLADQLGRDASLADEWHTRRSANLNFDRFVKRRLLAGLGRPLVWAIDEADRLLRCEYATEVFGLFRTWHNARALDPTGPWSQVTLIIGHATEASRLVRNLDQSPFNVGTRLGLPDFAAGMIDDLLGIYRVSLTVDEDRCLRGLLGGVPYLWRHALDLLVLGQTTVADLEARGHRLDGPFADHLRRLVEVVAADPAADAAMADLVQQVLWPVEPELTVLRDLGLLEGRPPATRWRCELYRRCYGDRTR